GAAEQVPRGMSGQWPNDLPYFIDLLFLDDPDEAPAVNDHPVTLCFAEVVTQAQIAIPVTGLSRSPGYQDAIEQVIAEQGNGVALRLVPDDFEDADELEETLEAFPGFLGVEPSQIDLVLDIGTVGESSAGTVAQIHRANI